MDKRIAIFGATNLVSALLALLATLWAANLAGPRLMGIFNALQLLLIYAPLLALGVFNGLNRELPYSIGQGRPDVAKRLASVALYVCGAICAAAFAGLVVLAFGAWHVLDSYWFLGLCFYALVVPITLYRIYLEVTFRTTHDFGWLSLARLLTEAASIMLVALMYLQVWGGMLARVLLAALIGTYLLWRRRPFRVAPGWDRATFLRLVSAGLPIFMVGYLYLLFTSVDRLLIVANLDAEALGAYTPALLILQGMAILPGSVAQVLYPRAAEQYGREGTIRNLAKLAFLPIPVLLALQLPVVLLAWHYMDQLIMHFMPQFEEGIAAARWSLWVGLVFSLTTPALVFNVARRQALYAAILLWSILSAVVAWKLNAGQGLEGVAMGMLVGGLSFSALSAVAAWQLIRRDAHGKTEETHSRNLPQP
jgi:O-antigen/teichoic acid export membrane protein